MKSMRGLTLSFFLVCGVAKAQNCGGMPAVNGVCIPPDSPTSPLNSTYGQSQSRNVVAAPVWANRWGAVAADGPNAILGAVTGMSSKRKAEKEALAQCRMRGGVACKVDLSYYNQCIVLVSGDSSYIVQAAATIDEASKVGIGKCNGGDVNCRVHYADCSLAERIR